MEKSWYHQKIWRLANVDIYELEAQLAQHTNAEREPRKRHNKFEWHITCPKCNHASSPRDPHCSFSVLGWKCFSCGERGTLWGLAKLVGFETGQKYELVVIDRKPVEAVFEERPWMRLPGLIERFESHPNRFVFWQAYKPLFEETITKYRLGVGALPECECKHERLLVPIFDGEKLVGLRGRQIKPCDCKGGKKWLTSYGTLPQFLPLYNIDAVKQGCIVFMVENPVDALAFGESTEYVGVATYSTAYWYPEWGNALARKCPESVIVLYDNDLPGNGGAQRRDEFIKLWMSDPKHKRVPEPAGPKRVGNLKESGVDADLFDWKDFPYKADVGLFLEYA
jgi:hypothetical protein